MKRQFGIILPILIWTYLVPYILAIGVPAAGIYKAQQK